VSLDAIFFKIIRRSGSKDQVLGLGADLPEVLLGGWSPTLLAKFGVQLKRHFTSL